MEKQIYTDAQMEIIHFEVFDIITTSNGIESVTPVGPTGGGGGVVLPDDEW